MDKKMMIFSVVMLLLPAIISGNIYKDPNCNDEEAEKCIEDVMNQNAENQIGGYADDKVLCRFSKMIVKCIIDNRCALDDYYNSFLTRLRLNAVRPCGTVTRTAMAGQNINVRCELPEKNGAETKEQIWHLGYIDRRDEAVLGSCKFKTNTQSFACEKAFSIARLRVSPSDQAFSEVSFDVHKNFSYVKCFWGLEEKANATFIVLPNSYVGPHRPSEQEKVDDYKYTLKIKPASCPESKVDNQVKVRISGKVSYVNSKHRPNTSELITFDFLGFYDMETISSIEIELVDRTDFLVADWGDVYDYSRGIVYRFIKQRITIRDQETFSDPSRRDMRTAPVEPAAVVMCHLHTYWSFRRYLVIRGPRHIMLLDRHENYPCTHIVYGKGISIRSRVDLKPNSLYRIVRLRRQSGPHKEKVLLSIKIDNFQFNQRNFIISINYCLHWFLFDGIELDTGHSQYHKIANKAALNNLIVALRKRLNLAKYTKMEISVVVQPFSNSDNYTKLYDIDLLSRYADYVVVNAVVDEWPDPSPSNSDMSTVSPSSLFIANAGGESQCASVAGLVKTGMPRDKIILPFTTYAWNKPYCVPGFYAGCVGFYKYTITQVVRRGESPQMPKVPYYDLCNGRKPYMDQWPYKTMQTGPGVPHENAQTVRRRMDYLKFEGLRGTKVMYLQYDQNLKQCAGGAYLLTTLAYRELVDPLYGRQKEGEAEASSGRSAGTGGLSAVVVTTIICVHVLYGGLLVRHVTQISC